MTEKAKQNITISIEEFRLLTSAIYQLRSIASSESEYVLNMNISRAKETLEELKQINNNFYKI